MSSSDSTYFNSYAVNYVRNKFKNYYLNNRVSSVVSPEAREFGIGDFGKKISARHLFFNSITDFNFYLKANVPFHISYSVGYFKYPEKRPMEAKEWTGADIVYEFDADDFDLPCKNEHDTWVCKNEVCNKTGYGHLDKCTECGSPVEVIEWTCEKCLGKAKEETLKLIDMLVEDFSLDPNYFIISFSGSKGYHVRITDPKIIPLSKASRAIMMHYILGNDINLEKLGFTIDKKQWSIPSPDKAKGWGKKILNYLITIIRDSNEKELKSKLNITSQKAKLIYENKEVILNKMYHNSILWSDFTSQDKFWSNFLYQAIENIKLKIDPSVAQDIYKIVRVPDTIHGGTGFLAKSIKDEEELKGFDPFKDPIVFKSDIKKTIKILKPIPKFKLLNKTYGPYEIGEIKELEEHICIYFILKGVGTFE